MATESIALVLYPGCILFELALALEFLAKKFRVETFSPSGGPIATSFGTTLESRAFHEGLPKNCRAILVPGGDFSSIAEDDALSAFLQAGDKAGLTIAAICGGAFALGRAGILRGKKFVHPFSQEQLKVLGKYFEGAEAHPEKEFLHHENLLTAQPFSHIDFAVELAARLGAIPAEKIVYFKNYHRGLPRGKIRPLALAIIQRPNGQILLHEGWDRVKKEKFYRPLGGGVEFGESARLTVARELQEEIGQAVDVGRELGVVENLFTFEGREGHEIIVVFEANLKDPLANSTDRFLIDESGSNAGYAVWRSLQEMKDENAPLFPLELSRLLERAKQP